MFSKRFKIITIMAVFPNVTNEWFHHILSRIFRDISGITSKIVQNVKLTK